MSATLNPPVPTPLDAAESKLAGGDPNGALLALADSTDDSGRSYWLRGRALLQRNADQADLKDAIADLYAASHRLPTEPSVRCSLARALNATGAHSEAMAVLRSALRDHPHHPAVRHQLGTQLLNQKNGINSIDAAEACNHLQAALDVLDASDRDGHLATLIPLATALAASGDLEHAATAYRSALALDPTNLAAALGYGAVQSARGDHKEALPWLERVLDSNPDVVEAWSHAGRSIAALGDLNAAASAFRCWTELSPGDSDGWLSLGWTLMRQGDTVASETAFAEAVKQGGNDPMVWLALGYAYLDGGAFDQAGWALDAALSQPGESAPAAFAGRGVAILRQGRIAESRADLFAARQLLLRRQSQGKPTPDAALVHAAYAWACHKDGDTIEALALLQTALSRPMPTRDRVLLDGVLAEVLTQIGADIPAATARQAAAGLAVAAGTDTPLHAVMASLLS